jgi:hypothetical protein
MYRAYTSNRSLKKLFFSSLAWLEILNENEQLHTWFFKSKIHKTFSGTNFFNFVICLWYFFHILATFIVGANAWAHFEGHLIGNF